MAKPFFLGASENPCPGKLSATTSKLGWSGDASTNKGMIFRTSMKLPGPVKVHVESIETGEGAEDTYIREQKVTELPPRLCFF